MILIIIHLCWTICLSVWDTKQTVVSWGQSTRVDGLLCRTGHSKCSWIVQNWVDWSVLLLSGLDRMCNYRHRYYQAQHSSKWQLLGSHQASRCPPLSPTSHSLFTGQLTYLMTPSSKTFLLPAGFMSIQRTYKIGPTIVVRWLEQKNGGYVYFYLPRLIFTFSLLLAVTAIGLNALQRYEHTESVVIVYGSWAHIVVTF